LHVILIGQPSDRLMYATDDEPSTQYGWLAEAVMLADDYSWVRYRRREEARSHDGGPILICGSSSHRRHNNRKRAQRASPAGLRHRFPRATTSKSHADQRRPPQPAMEQQPKAKTYAMTWAQRLKRVFAIDIEKCERCSGPVRVIASIEDPDVIEKILKHLGLDEASLPHNRSPPEAAFEHSPNLF
jgi:pyruvate/2-oxoglutarate dehydrogenase complex dihydrolipoamide acyltransferase (E2) component